MTSVYGSASHPQSQSPEEESGIETALLEMRVYWGSALLSMNHYFRPRQVTLGETQRADVFLASDGLPADPFPLVRFDSGRYILTLAPGMAGELERGGRTLAVAEVVACDEVPDAPGLPGCKCVPLGSDMRAVVRWGGVAMALRFVSPPGTKPKGVGWRWDLPYLNILVITGCVHLLLLVTLFVSSHEIGPARGREIQPRAVTLHLRPALRATLPRTQPLWRIISSEETNVPAQRPEGSEKGSRLKPAGPGKRSGR